MKIITIVSLCIMILVSSASAQSSEANEVAAQVESLRKAMIEADKVVLGELAAKELSYGHSSGKIENKMEFLDAIISGKNDFKTIDLSDQTVTLVKDMAIVRHIFTAEVINNGILQTPKIGVMQIWIKQNNYWQLLARQAFKF